MRRGMLGQPSDLIARLEPLFAAADNIARTHPFPATSVDEQAHHSIFCCGQKLRLGLRSDPAGGTNHAGLHEDRA